MYYCVHFGGREKNNMKKSFNNDRVDTGNKK